MSEAQWMWVAWGAMAGFVGVYGWVWKKAGERGRTWLEWGLAAVVAGVSAASVATHEPWADELHTWLQARDLSVGELWREMAYEGHFLPWHLILHPFATLGVPVETMGWLSWAINAATVAWFARKAPLGGWAKAAVGLSCVFLYVNPVLSRPYVLIPSILFGLAALWKKRDERSVAFGALVALLANTHVCMEGTAAAVFLVFAWENILHRADGKGWRECGRQWGGLAAMVAGGTLALAQVLPSLWKSGVELGKGLGLKQNFSWMCQGPESAWLGWAVAAGLACLGVGAWRWDKGAFAVFSGSLAFMAHLALFLYPAAVVNRALLWWPVAAGTGWALAGRGKRTTGNGWAELALVAMGLGLTRPDMTWRDWRGEYDATKGICRDIARKFGKDAEVWLNGADYGLEGAAAYLDNLWNWQTERRAELIHFKEGGAPVRSFAECRESHFSAHPEKESMLVLADLGDTSGPTVWGAERFGMTVEIPPRQALCRLSPELAVLKVRRGNIAEREAFGRRARGGTWVQRGMEKLSHGDRAGALAAWERAVEEDSGQWEAMNNLAWVLLEEGRVAEARAWIDRAMEHEAARASAGARDTEAAVRRAEEGEAGERSGP